MELVDDMAIDVDAISEEEPSNSTAAARLVKQ
jgi:hypothetical protein